MVITYVEPEATAGKVINANLFKSKREKKRYSPIHLYKPADYINAVNKILTGYKWRYIRTVDSAAGTVKNARNSKFQAVFPLRGKIINAEKHNEIDVLNNKEIRDLIIQVGCGVREDINLKKLRYDKIILLCDADA